jgi:hypothetical protein
MDIKDFLKLYANAAINKIKENPPIGVFDDYVCAEVVRLSGYPEDIVKRVYHPVFWTLFQGDESPFLHVQASGKDSTSTVKLRRAISSDELVKLVLELHGDTTVSRFNNPAQSA